MHYRCYNKNAMNYKNYGGRGISVCERWFSFKNFLMDMGERPHLMTLDRENNSESYGPTNCRWATKKQQCRNTRRCRLFTWDGRSLIIQEWSEVLNIKAKTLSERIRKWGICEKTFSRINHLSGRQLTLS